MTTRDTRDLIADLFKNPSEANRYMKAPDTYLSNNGVVLPDNLKNKLNSIIGSLNRENDKISVKGSHTNVDLTTHTDQTMESGHVDNTHHTNYSSKT
jgi:histidinol phosphatase-like PHP family hydrolase